MLRRVIFLLSFLITINTTVFGIETILFIRHGEKPIDGLGQLSCKGMNRSLSLPNMILRKFGTPDILIAPNPVIQKEDKDILYNYLRPLATIEPLAIKISKNIDLSCGYDDVSCVGSLLLEEKYNDKVLLIAWEHHKIEDILKYIATAKNITLNIPSWKNDNYDTIYVLHLGKDFIDFKIEQQELNYQNENCNF
jgi:hypothetical protein